MHCSVAFDAAPRAKMLHVKESPRNGRVKGHKTATRHVLGFSGPWKQRHFLHPWGDAHSRGTQHAAPAADDGRLWAQPSEAVDRQVIGKLPNP